mmetsp:Transcript_9046/g.14433  ORF Transcript_9046/g.14433 Transcript_9046/m.14433 type:complete len:89 (+) Transcript_9046:82-348(+)
MHNAAGLHDSRVQKKHVLLTHWFKKKNEFLSDVLEVNLWKNSRPEKRETSESLLNSKCADKRARSCCSSTYVMTLLAHASMHCQCAFF